MQRNGEARSQELRSAEMLLAILPAGYVMELNAMGRRAQSMVDHETSLSIVLEAATAVVWFVTD